MLALRRRSITRTALVAALLVACDGGPNAPAPRNPTPGISGINPANVDRGRGALTLIVTGTDFVNSSVVRVQDSDRATVFVNATELRAALPATDFEVAGNRNITVVNPEPGGGTSNTEVLTIGTPTMPNPTPGITQIDPTTAIRGRGELTLVVAGSDFVASSTVRVGGQDRLTLFISATELRATLPAADFEFTGNRSITVFNPEPGGGISNAVVLTVLVPTNPAPQISSVSPSFATAGAQATEVTMAGTGFMSESWATVDGAQHAVTYVSPTELRLTLATSQLVAGGARALRIFNPTPGGGASNIVSFEVRSPVPAISSFGENQTMAGQASYTLRVNGTGFISNSKVNFSGAPRETRFVSATQLEATLVEGDLRDPGTFAITVTNPTPGGGTSNALNFTLVAGTAEITLLPSSGASAGTSGFTLYVHGRGFVSGAVVQWNGNDRPTQYVSGTRLTATISAADVATAGAVQITVKNSPTSGVSAPVTLTVRNVGAVTPTTQTVTIKAGDIGYEPGSARIYASVKSTNPTNGNSVVAIDPTNGTVTGSTFVGSEPGKISLSGDGRVLYVGLDGASAVRRVDLPALTPALQWALPAGEVAGDMLVLPGLANTVAVSRQRPGYSPPLSGVTIYDNGVARPTSSPGHTGGNRIEALESASVIYGYNNAHTGFEFFTIGVDATGARHLNATSGLIGGFYTNIVGAAGRIYATDGSIVDAERRVRIGSLGSADALAIAPELGRAFLVRGAQLAVYDLNTFQLLGTVAIPAPTFDHPALVTTRLVRWGTDGVAFLDMTRLILVRSPILGP